MGGLTSLRMPNFTSLWANVSSVIGAWVGARNISSKSRNCRCSAGDRAFTSSTTLSNCTSGISLLRLRSMNSQVSAETLRRRIELIGSRRLSVRGKALPRQGLVHTTLLEDQVLPGSDRIEQLSELFHSLNRSSTLIPRMSL